MKKEILLTLALCFSLNIWAQNWTRILTGALKAGQAMSVSDADLAQMVRKEVEAMDQQNKVCDANDPYTIRLLQLTKNMKDANGIPLNFKVYQTTEYNAFACPDGSVRVYSALMDVMNDDELLGVIGHEIGHVALRHSKKAWRSALLRSAASDAIASQSTTWANLSDSNLGAITSAALSAKHSRSHETEADDYGYDFLKKSGRNPWALGLAFKKLKAMSGQKNSQYNQLLAAFSSHPDFDKRINRVKKKAQKDGFSTNITSTTTSTNSTKNLTNSSTTTKAKKQRSFKLKGSKLTYE